MYIYWSYTSELLTSSWASRWSPAPPNPLSHQCYCRHTAAEWTQRPFTHIQWAITRTQALISIHEKEDQGFRFFSILWLLLHSINPTTYTLDKKEQIHPNTFVHCSFVKCTNKNICVDQTNLWVWFVRMLLPVYSWQKQQQHPPPNESQTTLKVKDCTWFQSQCETSAPLRSLGWKIKARTLMW